MNKKYEIYCEYTDNNTEVYSVKLDSHYVLRLELNLGFNISSLELDDIKRMVSLVDIRTNKTVSINTVYDEDFENAINLLFENIW